MNSFFSYIPKVGWFSRSEIEFALSMWLKHILLSFHKKSETICLLTLVKDILKQMLCNYEVYPTNCVGTLGQTLGFALYHFHL
jgi:hypothetical protein